MRLKKIVTAHVALGLFVSAMQLSSVQAATKMSTVNFDPAKSQIKWVGKKVTGQHEGTIKLKSGQATLNGNDVTGGEFVVDMASLADTDLQNAAANAKLTGHLKSDDFFGVEKHPTAKLVIKSVKALPAPAMGQPTHEIMGDLTIKGTTQPITFPAIVKISDKNVEADSTLTIDRTKYDVRYGSGKFFENLGDKTIYDDFALQIHLVGQR